MENLFRMLAKDGGMIVSSNDCTTLEIAQARACGRMYVDNEGFGYVWFPTLFNHKMSERTPEELERFKEEWNKHVLSGSKEIKLSPDDLPALNPNLTPETLKLVLIATNVAKNYYSIQTTRFVEKDLWDDIETYQNLFKYNYQFDNKHKADICTRFLKYRFNIDDNGASWFALKPTERDAFCHLNNEDILKLSELTQKRPHFANSVLEFIAYDHDKKQVKLSTRIGIPEWHEINPTETGIEMISINSNQKITYDDSSKQP